jgi:branched-chain amino acid transport system ATP-binding protein
MNSENNIPILEARHVSKSFGKFKALQNVSTSFMPGTLTAIIGPNGAGKSTFFNVLSGAFPPTSVKYY